MAGTRLPRGVSKALLEQVMTSPGVRAALVAKARELATRADALGKAEGVDINATVREGTRPKGRPFAYVESANTAQEWGDRYTERRRVLGRTAQSG